MKKWIIPGLALAFALSLGNVATSDAMTTSEKIQKEADYRAADEASSETKMSLMATDERVIPASGSLPCVNGQTLDFTFANGVLTISGAGDALTNEIYIPDTTTAYRYYFSDNSSITSVVFTDDCQLTSLRYMFSRCKNLASVTNIPDTVTDLDDTFTGTALTSIPELPAGVVSMSYTFAHCEGITSVDFSTLPQGVKTFSGIFKDTGITTANLVITNPAITGELSYSYALSGCENLKTVTFDATGLNDDAYLWLQGICDGCPVLESFELINIPATNKEPGSVCSAYMFNECENLKTVKNEGYFDFSLDGAFTDCSSLTTIETKGFTGLYGTDSLREAFYNCTSLKGTFYMSFSNVSEFYKYVADLSPLNDYLAYSFAGCTADTTFYLGFEPLVNYLNQIKVPAGKTHSDANILYWPEGNTYVAPVVNTVISTPTVSSTPKVVTKKKISTLKLTKYKKGTKKITGKTIKKAKVVIRIDKKKYTVKADKKGNFKVTLKKKLKKKDKIKVTVSKSGYTSKTKTFKVK